MDEQRNQTLPDDWRENTGSDFLRMTGEHGIWDLKILKCEKAFNERFKKWEYRWTVEQLPQHIIRISTESSKRFCNALRNYEKEHGSIEGQEIRIGYVKERDSKGKEGKLWTIIPLKNAIVKND